jgi:hypothetical protein
MSIPASATNVSTTPPVPVNSGQQAAAQINPLLRTGKTTGEDHFSFKDVLDIINPLQHIPIVNNIYRSITGDQIGNGARIIGDALYGGFVGAAFGMANAVAVNETGEDMGGIAMTKMGLIKSQEDSQTASIGGKGSSATGDSSPSDADLANMPVVEVHPMPHVVNEAEDLVPKQITWDQPVSLASAATNTPAAMPSPKQLNDIVTGGSEPGAPVVADATKAMPVIEPKDQSADPSLSKADIQKNMLANLEKYQAMQQSANAGLILPKVPAQKTAQTDAEPKNNIIIPASDSADATAVAAEAQIAQYNKQHDNQ